jgi:hypothetical protein
MKRGMIMKKFKKIIIVFVAIFVLCLIGVIFTNDDSDTASENISSESEDTQPDGSDDAASADTDVSSEEDTSETSDNDDSTTEDSSDEKSDYPDSVDDVEVSFTDSVNQDTTGNWRLARVYTTKDTLEYALDYYNAFFKSDDEIHIIINYDLNTTTTIHCMVGQLFVYVRESVEDEEHSAKTLGKGQLLGEYMIDIETGVIERLDE